MSPVPMAVILHSSLSIQSRRQAREKNMLQSDNFDNSARNLPLISEFLNKLFFKVQYHFICYRDPFKVGRFN